MDIKTNYDTLENAVDSFLRIYGVYNHTSKAGAVTVDAYDLKRLQGVLEDHRAEKNKMTITAKTKVVDGVNKVQTIDVELTNKRTKQFADWVEKNKDNI